jgi:hypothetical protein
MISGNFIVQNHDDGVTSQHPITIIDLNGKISCSFGADMAIEAIKRV